MDIQMPQPQATSNIKNAIAMEIYEALQKFGARSDLLSIIGSYGNTMSDEWVLQNLHRWNNEEPCMADDKSKRDFRDRNRVSAAEEYEVEHFAQRNGITVEQTLALIRTHGNDRDRLTEAAKAFRERG